MSLSLLFPAVMETHGPGSDNLQLKLCFATVPPTVDMLPPSLRKLRLFWKFGVIPDRLGVEIQQGIVHDYG